MACETAARACLRAGGLCFVVADGARTGFRAGGPCFVVVDGVRAGSQRLAKSWGAES